MNEPPGARLRVGLSGLTMAEYFRDQGQDVLLFIDNIFRFVQAGSEVSALLGRMPCAVGYQPTLATEMGQLQERITSTSKGSVTSVQAIYVPADDLTDPAPANTFAHLDSTTVLSRGARRAGHLSGRRPARLDLPRPYPGSSPRSTTTRRRASRRSCSATRTCRTSSPSSVSRSSPTRTGSPCPGPARCSGSSPSRSTSPRSSPAPRASTSCSRHDPRLQGDHRGQARRFPEQAFYMVGPIEARGRARQAARRGLGAGGRTGKKLPSPS